MSAQAQPAPLRPAQPKAPCASAPALHLVSAPASSVALLTRRAYATPGPGWTCRRLPDFAACCPGEYVFNPALWEEQTAGAARLWQALHRWQE